MAQVITVNGPISPDELGVTLVHVHLLQEIRMSATELGQLHDDLPVTHRVLANKPVTIDMLGIIRRHISLVTDNAILGDVDEMIDEAMHYKRLGGDSMVDCTLVGMGRDPVGIREISRATGINVVCSTGWYLSKTHPQFVKDSSIEQLCEHMVRELTIGIGNTGIRAGALKSALSSPTPDVPFSGDEEKVLRATARAQAETDSVMCIHPSHHCGRSRHWHTYLDIIKNEGANLEKVHLCHMEWWSRDIDYQKTLLDRGANVAYDGFGNEYYMAPGMSFATDRERVEGVVELVKAGYTKQVVISNETSFKCGLRKYGGFGFGHLLENSVPDLKFYGVTDEQINTMLVENPKRLVAF